MARNKRGQFTSTNNNVEIVIRKYLEDAANEAGIRIRPLVRDELEQTLRSNIYDSYRPATRKSKDADISDKAHTRTKPRPYHHTGILARSIHGTIDGNVIKAGPMEGMTYPDGTSVIDVYNHLKFGTADSAKTTDVYSYDNGTKYSQYISQEPHNFEARTREYMNKIFLPKLVQELQTEDGIKRYTGKYKKRR